MDVLLAQLYEYHRDNNNNMRTLSSRIHITLPKFVGASLYFLCEEIAVVATCYPIVVL